ncbi:hypothetical protein SAMN05421780_108176 [Flexibacter flexilis DSM 6793]|uniref:Uncharacterized protein n=1 Tax=Flexibacter flexilis DSM 6793 TaxID=927664 RepID=A0A1I1LIX9_9BACT|nr:hypothetical protein [Flexibacter flexilis]SFC70928.1 hypothetical protein SAMN05421780_108176 [Flexibacter flexilis DSM 6793]
MYSNRNLLKASDTSSLFTAKIYYNFNHPTTGYQVEKRFYSFDFVDERENWNKTDQNGEFYLRKPLLKDYNGIQRFYAYLNELERKKQLVSATIAYNLLLDEYGNKLLIDKLNSSYPRTCITQKEFLEAQELSKNQSLSPSNKMSQPLATKTKW